MRPPIGRLVFATQSLLFPAIVIIIIIVRLLRERKRDDPFRELECPLASSSSAPPPCPDKNKTCGRVRYTDPGTGRGCLGRILRARGVFD
ncbi:hypothetical protein CEXT_8171 [Caerostris extrusa]|uniref:Uncharacterized protein n=1 Tax=Caerostris extrusa TaxID=172846 RepID=A0AAV4XV01_CAEEX|nr:hypothetical protein CEXT_8171 [Caerostris extrusa]